MLRLRRAPAPGPGGAGGAAAAAMGLLNFTRDPVPEAVSGDMHNLNQLSAQQFSALTEILFRFLIEPKEVERFLTQLSDFATMNKISLGPLKNIVKSILLVPNGALKRNLSSEQVRADFIALGLSEEKASYFAEQWKVNSPTLTRLAVGHTLMINQLIDMEWKFGVTAGSSELEKVGSIFLQVNLLHQRVQVVVLLKNKLRPGMWEALAVRGTRGMLDLIGTSSATVHLLQSSVCNCQQTAGTLLFTSLLKASCITEA
ncbi:COMM domain-containing protein 7 isoform X1 [Grus americana]|uniref:COMM domain-containing protein 7 isoform X1 n=1 Tax=Grus americana TaxID=9117 RepID=UPI002407E66B|nr:COMM domain-containing protein 7 isoform X1 [Grus americana]